MFDIISFGQSSIDEIIYESATYRNQIGGAALYVAAIGSSLGLRTGLVTRIGSDFANQLLIFLSKHEIYNSCIRVTNGTSTQLSLTYKGQSLESITISEGVASALSETDFSDNYLSTQAVYIAPAPYLAQVELARTLKLQGITTIFDPHADFENIPFEQTAAVLKNIDIFFANEQETLRLTQQQDLLTAITNIASAGPRLVIITKGAKGAWIWTKDELIEIPALAPDKVIDVVGAGDAFKTGFFWGMCHKLSLQECGLLGAGTAACIIEGIGLNSLPTREQIALLFEKHGLSFPLSLIG